MTTSTDRLNRQADAIKALREQMKDVFDRLAVLESATPSTAADPDDDVPTRGVYVPSTVCLVCGDAKEPGRIAVLTCKPCGRRYQAGIRGEAERLTFGTCGNCHQPKKVDTKMLCSPCSVSFGVFKNRVR